MSVQLVIDMNLSVEWVTELAQHGWSAVHWSTVGLILILLSRGAAKGGFVSRVTLEGEGHGEEERRRCEMSAVLVESRRGIPGLQRTQQTGYPRNHHLRDS